MCLNSSMTKITLVPRPSYLCYVLEGIIMLMMHSAVFMAWGLKGHILSDTHVVDMGSVER